MSCICQKLVPGFLLQLIPALAAYRYRHKHFFLYILSFSRLMKVKDQNETNPRKQQQQTDQVFYWAIEIRCFVKNWCKFSEKLM